MASKALNTNASVNVFTQTGQYNEKIQPYRQGTTLTFYDVEY